MLDSPTDGRPYSWRYGAAATLSGSELVSGRPSAPGSSWARARARRPSAPETTGADRVPDRLRRTPRAAGARGSSSGAAVRSTWISGPGRAVRQPIDLGLPGGEVGRDVGPGREDPELADLLRRDAAGGEVGDEPGGEAQPRVGDVHPGGQDRAPRRRPPGPPPSRRGSGRCRGRGSSGRGPRRCRGCAARTSPAGGPR